MADIHDIDRAHRRDGANVREALSIEVDAHAATRAQVEALREALEGAARSLHTAATWGTLVDYQGDLLDLRAWAANQEAMARAALSASPPGVRVGLTTEERAELKAILDQRGPGRLTVLARKLLDGEGT